MFSYQGNRPSNDNTEIVHIQCSRAKQREICFKQLAHTIVEAGKYKLQDGLAGWRCKEFMLQLEFEESVEENFPIPLNT